MSKVGCPFRCPTSPESCPTSPECKVPVLPARGNKMMLIKPAQQKFLTHVGHFANHKDNQRRFARLCPASPESVPHFAGIRIDLRFERKSRVVSASSSSPASTS
jgi:hypothetical protein